MKLSADSLAQIDREIAKYPPEQKQSAVMSALRIAQLEKGWLANETIEFVAQYLGMPSIAAYEVATFYNMFNLTPVGKYKITLCTNLSCTLMGALDIGRHLENRLGVGFGQTTEDGRFTLREGECMGACGDAPLCLINNHRMESFLTAEKVDALLDELK
ncbi:MAG TPA: NADH-quinone oxidoreductase subunit NuoE [Thiobacillaceae bacterium]|nr:NADH-quinone oxidoreductase subunit NuoE [Thiobacillaceae bacterium]